MDQLTKFWASLNIGQRIALVVLPLALATGIFSFSRWKHDSAFRVLYSSLAPEDAAAITQKLREGAIEYRMDETGGSVSVPAEKIAEARLTLASSGLPKSGRIGFEIFDRTNIGGTDFAEQVNYHRALEGELERTLATLSQIETARVHITVAKDSVFLESRQPSKATVVVRMKRANRLSASTIAAIGNLVSSAVEGLTPDRVAVIDSNGQLLSRISQHDDSEAQLAEANLDYRHRVETELLQKINHSLEPLLGENRFRAGISVDCDFTSAEQNDETLDPNGTVITTSQSTEESSAAGTASGVPGAASNLPRPVSRPAAGANGLVRRTENLAYQTSKTVRRVITPKGSIRKISAAVIIDQSARWEGVGPKARRVLTPPSPEVLKGVKDVVAGILGSNEQRGDLITVETLPFESTLSAEPPPSPNATPVVVKGLTEREKLIIGGAAGFLFLALGAFYLLRKKKHKAAAQDLAAAALEAGQQAAGGTAIADGTTAPTEPVLGAIEARMNDVEAQQAQLESEAMSRIKLPANSKASDVLLKHIREAVHKDPQGVTNILRSWVSDIDVRKS